MYITIKKSNNIDEKSIEAWFPVAEEKFSKICEELGIIVSTNANCYIVDSNDSDLISVIKERYCNVDELNFLVKRLDSIPKGIDVSCVGKAAESGAIEICKLLLEMGYSPNDKYYGKTALDIANEPKTIGAKSAAQTKDLLLEYGAKTSSELDSEDKIYTIVEEDGWFYIFENQNVLRSENGYFQVITKYQDLAIKVVEDLKEFGKDFNSPESIAYYHLTAINDFIVRLDGGRHIDFMKRTFLKPQDYLLSNKQDEEVNCELAHWFDALSTTQACAAYCLAKWCSNIYAVYKFAQFLETSGVAADSYINSIYKENSVEVSLPKRAFENFAYYYMLS